MTLMWLGSFFLMLVGLALSQKYVAQSLAGLQRTFLESTSGSSPLKMFVRALDIVLLEGSPQKSLYSSFALSSMRVFERKFSLLVMCLSTLGAWWVLLLGLLFMNFNGYFLLGISALSLLTVFMTDKVTNILRWIMGTGLFLIGGELMLRNASTIQSILGQSELAFFLVDGRFPTVVVLFVFAAFLSFFVQLEFWSFALSLSLLTTSNLSFNGALGLVAGERVGRMIFFYWQSRSLNPECRLTGKRFALFSSVGVILGLLTAGEARSFLSLGFSSNLTSYQDRNLQFVLFFVLILFFQWAAQMIWGHFASKTTVDGMQDARYFGSHWGSWGLLSENLLDWAKVKARKRHSEIRYHIQGLGSLEQGQVPEIIQSRLKAEEVQLNLFLHDGCEKSS